MSGRLYRRATVVFSDGWSYTAASPQSYAKAIASTLVQAMRHHAHTSWRCVVSCKVWTETVTYMDAEPVTHRSERIGDYTTDATAIYNAWNGRIPYGIV